jgi:hypothetical protein
MCGEALRVPEAPAVEPAGYGLRPAEVAPGAKQRPPDRPATAFRPAEPRLADERTGLIRAPRRAERAFSRSLLYPLWDGGGLSLLLCAPPVLFFTSMLSFGLRSYLQGGDEVTLMGALTLAFPMLCGLLVAASYTMMFLGAAFETSSRGEVRHPRWPPWELGELLASTLRWVASLAPGLALSGILAWLYLASRASPVKTYQEIIGLVILGSGMALLPIPLASALLHADARSANPLASFVATARAGPGVIGINLLFGLTGAVFLGVVPILYALPGLLAPIVATWAYWVLACYAALVLMRRLGLFYLRHAERLGWFPGRPRWGAG